jgi:hypothetical protein
VYYQKTRLILENVGSRGFAVVIVEHPAEFLLTPDTPRFVQGRRRFDEFVLDPLVIASKAIMAHEDRDGFAEMSFAQEDQPV